MTSLWVNQSVCLIVEAPPTPGVGDDVLRADRLAAPPGARRVGGEHVQGAQRFEAPAPPLRPPRRQVHGQRAVRAHRGAAVEHLPAPRRAARPGARGGGTPGQQRRVLAAPSEGDRGHRHPAGRHVRRARAPDGAAGAGGPLTDQAGPVASPDDVRDALKAVIDPELGLNIVDLGLVYDVALDGGALTVRYTLTTMACGLGPLIESGIKEVAGTLPFDDVQTELVFEPLWSPDRISAEGKAFLGI